MPIRLDNGGDAASGEARENELPVWRHSDITPKDLREGVQDEDDGDMLDDNDATIRRDECNSLAVMLEKEKEEWAKLTESMAATEGAAEGHAAGAADGAARAKGGKRKRAEKVDSGRAKGTLRGNHRLR